MEKHGFFICQISVIAKEKYIESRSYSLGLLKILCFKKRLIAYTSFAESKTNIFLDDAILTLVTIPMLSIFTLI